METTELAEVGVALSALFSAFERPMSDALLTAYQWGMEGISPGDVRIAVARAIRECKFLPKPVELRELAGEIPLENRAVLAFETLRSGIRKHGAYESVNFTDPVINATVRGLGGWERLCDSKEDDFLKWTRKEFEKLYKSLAASGVSKEMSRPLVGITERENKALGYAFEGDMKRIECSPKQVLLESK